MLAVPASCLTFTCLLPVTTCTPADDVFHRNGFVAQLAERTLSMCKVSGSIPDESTFCSSCSFLLSVYGDV